MSLIAVMIASCGNPVSDNAARTAATSESSASSDATSTTTEVATTVSTVVSQEDTIRVEIADGCPATVAGHTAGSSSSAAWITNLDASGLDEVFVPGEPTAALICRYEAVPDPTGASEAKGGALFSSTPLDSDVAATLATSINDIVPSSIVSACLFANQEARYTAIVFVVPGRSDVDLWLKDWIGCPELSNGIRASGELINGVGSAFLSQLDGIAPPAPQHHGFDIATSRQDPSACCPPSAILSPDVGEFADVESLVAALLAFGPLDNEEPAAVAEGVAPTLSICADIVMNNEPSSGVVVFQGLAFLQGVAGVVLVLRSATDSLEMRMYGVHESDPVTGGCPLLASAPITAG